jgi:K+-transporting ATPase ATPase C chain
MRLAQHLLTSLLMTVVTTMVFGLAYPLVVTGLAQVLFPEQANGEQLFRNGQLVGSRLLGQSFSAPEYFHGRPSAAGTGYDPLNSGGTNLGPTNKKLADAVAAAVTEAQKDNPHTPVPVDLVTSSGSGLDPHISPAAALFQVPRVAAARHRSEADIRALVDQFTEGRTLGLLGEPRVNVLLLNLALDQRYPRA